ncbi:hypothetical protein Ptr902_11451 [Pyrenophora tritici-repentis]|nr:hypothetical protein Ptr902_11451 [Pyrenophora tritici-repentis]
MNIYLISLIALASQAFGKDLECRRRDRCETLVDRKYCVEGERNSCDWLAAQIGGYYNSICNVYDLSDGYGLLSGR